MTDVLKSCLWAIAVLTPAACGGFAVIICAKAFNWPMAAAALWAGAIRLLLAAAGCVIIFRFVSVSALWFLAWLGLFYFIALVAEVYFAISIVNRHKEQRLVTVGSGSFS